MVCAVSRDKQKRAGDEPDATREKQKRSSGDEPVVAKLMVNPAGFGFAEPLDGGDSVYIPRGRLGVALDGDEVTIRFWASDKGYEGEIVALVRRGRTRLTGIPRLMGRTWVLEPDDPRVLWRPEMVGTGEPVRDDMVVVAAITHYPNDPRDAMLVQVERVLGPPDTLGTEQLKILIERGINPEFPEPVIAEAQGVPQSVQAEDLEGRADLRGLEFMTIDPVDARDFDDAVCVELLGSDPRSSDIDLHVAVADVSHYVREGTAIDAEAALRCFSAYLPDRAIPMLPHALSSHMCSLVPDADRLAMVVSMRLDAAGEASNIQLRAAVIHSRKRLSYEQVAAELEDEGKLSATEIERIKLLRRAADRLRVMRLHRGAVELNLPETKIILDQDDPSRIRDIVPSRASKSVARAYNLIEELMLAANEAVGQIAVTYKLPMVFRVHDLPDADKLELLAAAAKVLGMEVDPEKLRTPRGVQKFLSRAETQPRGQALHMYMLRSMAQASYSTDNLGHFALASPAYVHFTSPIRRYPDLVAHRVLKAHLARSGGQAGPQPVPEMPALEASQAQAARSSSRERSTADAERDSKALFAAAYMRDRIGDRFEATITGFGSAGMYILLDRPFVDGMIRLGTLERERGELYELEESGVRLVGKRSGHVLMLGDRLVVEATDSSLQRRKVDFVYVTKLALSGPAAE
jgi:ribonuclease R